MKYISTVNIILLMLIAGAAYAANQAPFGNEVSTVKNYNRATTQIATSGFIGEGGVQVLASHGFKTIIDLRTEAEGVYAEKRAVEAAGIHYINIPVTGAGINNDQLIAFTKAIENAQMPVLVHCASGNRAGALWATYRLSKGVSPNIAIEEGRTAGMQPEMISKVKETLLYLEK